jgi:hypothetical protein
MAVSQTLAFSLVLMHRFKMSVELFHCLLYQLLSFSSFSYQRLTLESFLLLGFPFMMGKIPEFGSRVLKRHCPD